MTNFIHDDKLDFNTLRVRPSLATDDYSPQGDKWLTDGAFVLLRGAVVNQAPLKMLFALGVSPNNMDQAAEIIVNNTKTMPSSAMYIDSAIFTSDTPEGDKGRDNRRIVYLASAAGQSCSVNADKLKSIMKALAPRQVQFWQATNKPTAPVVIQDGSTVLGLIMPVATLKSKAEIKQHSQIMRKLQSA